MNEEDMKILGTPGIIGEIKKGTELGKKAQEILARRTAPELPCSDERVSLDRYQQDNFDRLIVSMAAGRSYRELQELADNADNIRSFVKRVMYSNEPSPVQMKIPSLKMSFN